MFFWAFLPSLDFGTALIYCRHLCPDHRKDFEVDKFLNERRLISPHFHLHHEHDGGWFLRWPCNGWATVRAAARSSPNDVDVTQDIGLARTQMMNA